MSAPTGQAPPRPQVESTSSPPPSTLSTPGKRPKPRDPLKDPEAGELFVTKAGLWRRVLEVSAGGGVTFDWPHWPDVPAQAVTGGAWRAWASAHRAMFQKILQPQIPGVPHPFDPAHGGGFARGVTHRDIKPANMLAAADTSAIPSKEPQATAETASRTTADPAPGTDRDLKPANVLCERDAKALRGLYQLRDGAGVVRGTLAQILRASGISPTTWQDRARPSLERLGLIRSWLDPIPGAGARLTRCCQITPEGLEVARTIEGVPDTAGVGPVSGTVSARCRPGASSLSSPNSTGEAKKQPNQETPADTASPTPVPAPVSGPTPPPPDLEALLARALAVIEEQARTIAELSARVGAAPAQQTKNIDEGEGGPCPDCGAPTVQRRNPTTGARFLGCSTFPTCSTTRSLEPGGASAPPKRPGKAAKREEAERARAEIEEVDRRSAEEQAARTRALLERQAQEQQAKLFPKRG